MAVWPMVLDIPKDDCSRILRRMELQTYGSCISVLRAQGPLTKEKRQAIENLRQIFHIKTDRHKAEVRRAVNDELLATIADRLYGANTDLDWAVEGRRLVPLVRRLEPITAYTPIANEVAEMTHIVNASLPPPRDPSRSPTPETDDAEETMEEMEMAPPPPPPPPPQPQLIAPVKLPVQTLHQTPVMAATPLSQPPMAKVEKAASRKRRVSSFESSTQNIPPPSKIPYIPPASTPSRTVSIPVGVSSTTTRMPTIPTSIRPSNASTSATPKVLIVSSSASVTTPSLLQRSLSVPMVKTVKSIGAGLMSTTVAPGTSSFQGTYTTSLGAPLLGAPKIRPKTVAPPTVLPKGRGGSIVIPLSHSIPGSGVQLRPPTVVQTKPTLQPVQVKQDASGVKVISGSHKITPKPPTVTVTSGSNRIVTIASAPRISPMISSSPSTLTSATITTHAASLPVSSMSKPLTLSLPSSSNVSAKQNVILVKKGGSGGFTPVQNQGNISLSGPGRVIIQGTPHTTGHKGVASGETASSLAHALHLPPGSRQGNVIVLDLSQEQINKNTTLTDLLHASGLISVKPSTSKGDCSEEMQITTETVNIGVSDSKVGVKEVATKSVMSSASAKLKTKILRAVPTRAKTQEPSEYSIKLVSGRASVESSSNPVVQAKVVREIASKPPEPRVIKFDEVAKEVAPKKILPAKDPQKIEVKLQPSIKPLLEPNTAIDFLPESENILVNLIDQVVESSVSICSTPSSSTAAMNTEKLSPQEESLHEFLTFKKTDDMASKKVLAMLQEEPSESVEVCTSLPSLDANTEMASKQNPT